MNYLRFEVGITVLRQYDRLIECLRAIKKSTIQPEKIFIIDNGRDCFKSSGDYTIITPGHNLGVAASWNLLLKLIHPSIAIITQDDCIVAPDTFEKMMTPDPEVLVTGMGWACFRQDPGITNRIGRYDERFYPAYYEDCDYKIRMKKMNGKWIDLGNVVASHGNHGEHPYQFFNPEQKRIFDLQVEANKQYFISKWGGLPSEVGV
jgi:GT2 family glycosyltransferase